MEVDLVLVSPLKRAIRTALEIFKDKPVKFMLIPQMCEALQSSCDVSDIRGIISTFQDWFKSETMTFYEPLDVDWQKHLFFDETTTYLEEQLSKGEILSDIFFKRMEAVHPQFLESDHNLKLRI